MTVAPAVSIIAPCHNVARWVGEFLASVAAQDLQDWEAILVDDGSTDGTREILEEWARRDPRFRVLGFPRPHGGPARARNAGLRVARSGIVVLADGDDVLLPGVLARGRRLLELAPGAGFACFDWRTISEEGDVLEPSGLAPFRTLARARSREIEPGARILDPAVGWPVLLRGNFVRESGLACRKEAVLAAGGFDESLTNGDGYDLLLRLAWDRPFVVCREPGALYRRWGGSISRRPSGQLLRNRVRVLERQWDRARRAGATGVLRRRLAAACEGMGWAEREAGRPREAARWYLRSLRFRPGPRAAWGLVSLLPVRSGRSRP